MRLAVLMLAAALGAPIAAQQQVYEPGNGVTPPILLEDVKPGYTPGAMAAKIEGSVLMKAVVLDNGRIGDIEVVKSLHPELDEEAIKALRLWVFRPGTREGKPVAVRIHCEMNFTLK